MSARDDYIPPAPSPTDSADGEVLHQNERTLISRRRLPDGRTVIDKHALGADAQQRLKHEAGVLDHLADVPGVVKRVLDAALPGALCFADDGSTALSKRLGAGRLDTPTVLSIAIDLAHITERGFWDVARTTSGPLIASHSNAHALTEVARNLTDKPRTLSLDGFAAPLQLPPHGAIEVERADSSQEIR